MSNELTIPEYLNLDSIKDDLASQASLVGNPASLYPTLKMNKDMQGFVINLGDQVVDRPSEVFYVILGDENFYGSRALFPPGNSDSTTPVCATRLASPANKSKWTGNWNNESGYPAPMEGIMLCSSCPWGKFGSDPQWDDSKNGAGPACKERRALYGVRVEESSVRNHYRLVDDTVIRMVLPATSIKTTQSMAAKATANKVPLSAAVFRLSNKIESRGSIKWSILEADLVGIVGDKDSYNLIQGIRKKVRAVVSDDESLDDSPYNDTSASTGAPAPAYTSASTDTQGENDEIPF